MASTRSQAWQEVLAVIHGVSQVEDLDDFGVRVLEEIERLIPSDMASFNEVDPIRGRASVVTRPTFAPVPRLDAWQRWSHQHPVVMHNLKTGDGSARRLSDFVSSEELHALELYIHVFGPLGVEYQVSVGLPAPLPLVLGVALNRHDRDFSGDEIALLNSLRPHLVQAYRSTQLLTEQRRALDSITGALEQEGRTFHVIGRPLTGSAATLVRSYFGESTDGLLPPAVNAWVEAERLAFESGPADRLRQPLVSDQEGRRLTVRFIPGGRGPDLLFFDERLPEQDAQPLRRLGLSAREAEVLWWLSKGSSTGGIAAELGVSVGTVKKHLERVYRKLGVSTRTAAVAQVHDVLIAS